MLPRCYHERSISLRVDEAEETEERASGIESTKRNMLASSVGPGHISFDAAPRPFRR